MKGRVMSAFALALSITGTVISITAIVLASCSLAMKSRRPSHFKTLHE